MFRVTPGVFWVPLWPAEEPWAERRSFFFLVAVYCMSANSVSLSIVLLLSISRAAA